MPYLDLNTTETTNIDQTTIGLFDNRSKLVLVLFMIALFAPSFGCTLFLLFHIGRLHARQS